MFKFTVPRVPEKGSKWHLLKTYIGKGSIPLGGRLGVLTGERFWESKTDPPGGGLKSARGPVSHKQVPGGPVNLTTVLHFRIVILVLPGHGCKTLVPEVGHFGVSVKGGKPDQ